MENDSPRLKAERSNSDRRAESPLQDQRAKRSKKALQQGLLALIGEMPFADITVDDIAGRAGVGRATFYRHYATKDELIAQIASDEIERLVDLTLPLLSMADTRVSCLALCRHVDQHRGLWVTLLTGGASGVMRETFIRLAKERGPQQVTPVPVRIPVSLGAVCGVAITFEILSWWLEQDEVIPPEQVAEYLDQLAVTPAFAR